MRFLIDHQLPVRLATWFRDRGHIFDHVARLGMQESDDRAIWDFALTDRRVVVSKDDDFLILACRPGDTVPLVWVRLGNIRNPVLLAAFDRVYVDLLHELSQGKRVVEIR